MKKGFVALLGGLILLSVFSGTGIVTASNYGASGQGSRMTAKEILDRMSPEERVGQLFLVTFQGTDTTPNSMVYDLIANHHVGGVVLRADNNNIPSSENLNQYLYDFNSQLQTIEYESSQMGTIDPQSGRAFQTIYIPLFIGIEQEGDGYPTDQVLSGVTSMPSEMAIGATWNPEVATQAGVIMGAELDALGFNLLLGPSLDVLETPKTEGTLDLGNRLFGGDPFWVGEIAKAYISGVHQGSSNHMIVVVKHFPGYGGADRLPGEEVATVRKSLEQLKQIELAPFFAVCTGPGLSSQLTDALLVSHIRYQGFQGNIRATTRPVSFDASTLSQLISLPEIAPWRSSGGLLISDDLGNRAVRRFYDPAEKVFDARLVARNAFLAGNDMLYLGNMRSGNDPDSYTSIIGTLDSFSQKYREDPTFAARVDDSVLTILAKKIKIYPDFNYPTVIPAPENLGTVGGNGQTAFDILSQGATLISPDRQDLDINLPNPPALNEQVIIFTSTETGKQCPACLEQPVFAVDGLQQAILKSYGPPNGSQVRAEMLRSYSFKDLTALMANTVTPENLERDLAQSDWVVFSMLNVSLDKMDTEALRVLLANHYELVRNKKIIVFAFAAPYYLDATDISKITAYYGIFSKVPQALNVAARILFHELIPEGASPVSIPGTGYDLIQVTSPDAAQIIPLMVDYSAMGARFDNATLQPTELPLFHVGDKLRLITGVIVDQNGNQVPDGTTVRFVITRTQELVTTQQLDSVTSAGVARGQFTIDSGGFYEIKVTSEPAVISQILQLNVSGEIGGMVTAIAPTPIIQATEFGASLTPDGFTLDEDGSSGHGRISFGIWILAGLLMMIEAALGYWIFTRGRNITQWGIRSALLVFIFGWLAYFYMGLGFPGSEVFSTADILFMTVVCGGMGILVTIIWRLIAGARIGN